MAKRIKAPAAPLVTSREKADWVLGEIGIAQRALARIDADLTDRFAQLKADAAAAAAPLATEIKLLFAALAAWATQERQALCADGRKTVTLSQGTIGWRLGNPKIRLDRGQTDDDVISWLYGRGWRDLLRTIEQLDRDAMLRDAERTVLIPGVRIEQIESFYARPLDLEAEQTVTVARLQVDPEPRR